MWEAMHTTDARSIQWQSMYLIINRILNRARFPVTSEMWEKRNVRLSKTQSPLKNHSLFRTLPASIYHNPKLEPNEWLTLYGGNVQNEGILFEKTEEKVCEMLCALIVIFEF